MFLKLYLAFFLTALSCIGCIPANASEEEMLSSPETDCVIIGAMLNAHPKSIQNMVRNARLIHGDDTDAMVIEAKEFYTSYLLTQDYPNRIPVLGTLWDIYECETLTDPMEKVDYE